MKNKRGLQYEIIVSIILGLIVLSIGLWWIFQEYFEDDAVDWQLCRQSVVLRDNMPNVKKIGLTWTSLKSEFPLKCKTQVVTVAKEDVENNLAGKIIGDTLMQCWYLYGNGDFDVFPSKFLDSRGVCAPCARISLEEDAKDYLRESGKKIDIEKSLDTLRYEDVIYRNYLENVGSQFPALNPGFGREFDLGGDEFLVDESLDEKVVLRNKKTGEVLTDSYLSLKDVKMSKVSLPKFLDPEKGDLVINFGSVVYSGEKDIGGYIPYLFYFQINQKEDPFKQMENNLMGVINFCSVWDGIPG